MGAGISWVMIEFGSGWYASDVVCMVRKGGKSDVERGWHAIDRMRGRRVSLLTIEFLVKPCGTVRWEVILGGRYPTC